MTDTVVHASVDEKVEAEAAAVLATVALTVAEFEVEVTKAARRGVTCLRGPPGTLLARLNTAMATLDCTNKKNG